MSSLEDVSPQQRDQLALLSKNLSDDPSTRKEFLKLAKRINPGLAVPEIEIEERTNKVLETIQRENEDLRNSLKDRERREDLDKKRQSLIKRGLAGSDEDVADIEKVMLEKHIPDHETGAQYWAWMKQAAVPTPTGYNPSAISKFNLSQYMKNPTMSAREEASKALQDLRSRQSPIRI